MSAINITNVTALDNPAPFVSPFQFEISYECLTSLKDGDGLLRLFWSGELWSGKSWLGVGCSADLWSEVRWTGDVWSGVE
ncbi:hypothetical protein F2Q69_00020020 [Brassica cretica]|uniref:Uncharacterized protein n=1 Tax=Brassica cretica TaxID=69181 RepID=A0A8S9QCM7_BRACR|nr:hypothetical protein F2Q69_00020020 [Brassica cretica]